MSRFLPWVRAWIQRNRPRRRDVVRHGVTAWA